MKSPWKFVAQLVSRRRASSDELQEPENEPEVASAAGGLKVLPSPEPEHIPERDLQPSEHPEAMGVTPTSPTETTASTDTVVSDTPSSEAPVPVDIPTVEPVEAAAPEVKAISEHELPSPAGATSRRARKNAGQKPLSTQVASEAVGIENISPVDPSPSKSATSNALSDLDAEILQLRKQLAEKLRLQNAQLRALLERYESR